MYTTEQIQTIMKSGLFNYASIGQLMYPNLELKKATSRLYGRCEHNTLQGFDQIRFTLVMKRFIPGPGMMTQSQFEEVFFYKIIIGRRIAEFIYPDLKPMIGARKISDALKAGKYQIHWAGILLDNLKHLPLIDVTTYEAE
jgi:hypothetical protein